MAMLDENSYFGKLVDAGLGEIGEKKTPAMVLTFEIDHHNAGGKWESLTQVRRDVAFFLSEKARESAFSDLMKLGFNGDMDAPKFSADLYDGTELTVEHEQYNGKASEKVRIAKLKPAGRERKPVAKDVARLLAAQFKQAAASTARPSAPPPAAPPKPAAPIHDPDDHHAAPF